MGVIENANHTPLDPGLMKRMMMCLEEMPEEQRGDMTGRSIGLITIPNIGHGRWLNIAVFIHNVLIETAAVQPLIERNKGPAFDPVTFFRAALERAESEGRAWTLVAFTDRAHALVAAAGERASCIVSSNSSSADQVSEHSPRLRAAKEFFDWLAARGVTRLMAIESAPGGLAPFGIVLAEKLVLVIPQR